MPAAERFEADPMQNTSYVALSRQMTMARELELVANNIANAETTAYRRIRSIPQSALASLELPRPVQRSCQIKRAMHRVVI